MTDLTFRRFLKELNGWALALLGSIGPPRKWSAGMKAVAEFLALNMPLMYVLGHVWRPSVFFTATWAFLRLGYWWWREQEETRINEKYKGGVRK